MRGECPVTRTPVVVIKGDEIGCWNWLGCASGTRVFILPLLFHSESCPVLFQREILSHNPFSKAQLNFCSRNLEGILSELLFYLSLESKKDSLLHLWNTAPFGREKSSTISQDVGNKELSS